MKFAIECHAAEDWAEPEHSTGYVYGCYDDAAWAAHDWIRLQVESGMDPGYVGATVISDERDEWDNPVVEEDFTATQLGLG